jgi:hypothetical protein
MLTLIIKDEYFYPQKLKCILLFQITILSVKKDYLIQFDTVRFNRLNIVYV